MKRNMNLIRKLLLRIEEFPPYIDKNYDYTINFRGYSIQEKNFHLDLLKDAGLIDGIIHKSVINKYRSIDYTTLELTWKGYEFLDSARNNKLWKKAIKETTGKFGSFSFELLKSVLIQMSKDIILHN